MGSEDADAGGALHPLNLRVMAARYVAGLSACQPTQLIGLAVLPLVITMKCRWHPVEYPVLPT